MLPAIAPKTRSPPQKPACKDLSGAMTKARAITPEATYTPVSTRGGSRSSLLDTFFRDAILIKKIESVMRKRVATKPIEASRGKCKPDNGCCDWRFRTK